ncbi:MAG: trypsin-like peptidase domain-containing protein [Candidatus Bathyarchaeota archaeon]|nr:trypsin-like peptidase domain-containing protein [Candidatus Bathyarchaeota archaeon]
MPYDEASVLDVVAKVSQSVVNINTVRLLQDVFYRVVPIKGMGSGTIIDSKGYVLTNNHVIEGAEKIEVTLTAGEVLAGKLAGVCATTDIAVIKVESTGIPAADLGDSDKLKVGQRVFAIGNPFGLAGGPSVTAGVISAVNRSIRSERGVFEGLVQTDAAINPGNSGGPLVDVQGRVVAISTAIIPFAQGIGFAIPINSARMCSEEIVLHGKVVRPWVGVSGLSVTREIADYYSLAVDSGVLVAEVVPRGPAQGAGLAKGDVIVGLDDSRIRSVEELQKEVKKRKIRDKIRLLVVRDSQKLIVELVLKETP